MKRSILTVWISAACLTATAGQIQNPTWPWLRLNDSWKFSAGDNMEWSQPKFNDSQWADLKTTDFWEAQDYYDLEGFAWYRQQVAVPKAWKSAVKSQGGLYLSYSNADDADEAFFNGVSIGKTGDFPPTYQGRNGVLRKYFVPAKLIKFDKPNTVALRVYDGGGQGGVMSNDIYLSVVNPIMDMQLRLQCDDEDWVFDNADKAKVRVTAKPTVKEAVDCQLVCRLTTDFHEAAGEKRIPVKLEPGKELNQEIALPVKNPGYYHIDIYIDYDGLKSQAASTNIGLSPNHIWSPSDAKPDFEAFWKKTREELDAIPGDFKMQEDASLSNANKKVYRVEMTSFGGERIKATFSVPNTKGPHPALLTNLGYSQGEDFGTVNPNNMPGYCELVLSVRGQGLDIKNNKYGEWITYGLKSKEDYYYRGAYMDLVRAVDFLCTRPEVDAENIFAGGLSQGGALTLAAAALDRRIKAAAPCVPFLSDFPDYFRIVTWPRDRFEVAIQQDKSLTWDGIYEVLSYFDIKNLARFIHCPVLLGSGLQDGICPPHTHFAGFNNIPGDLKRTYKIYPNESHGVEPSFYEDRSKFFEYYTSHNAQDFPVLKTGKKNVDKAFTLAVETLFKNTPDSLIKAGGEYGGEWTRDVSINSWNAAALLMPEKTAYSLWSVTTDNRSLIGHQYWDQIIWVTAAYDYYLKTGDKAFLRQAYVVSANTMKKLENEQFDADYGMFMGPSVFNDGIAGYEEPIFDTAHRSSYVLDFPGAKRIKCLSTNSIYYNAYVTLAKMAALAGDKAAEKTYTKKAADLRASIRKNLFDAKTSILSYLVDAEDNIHPHQETLGVAFAILFGVVNDAEARQVIANVYTGKHGVPSIYPHFKRFDKEHPGRHNQIVWPFVNAFWADAAYSKGRKDIFSFELQNLADLATGSNNCFYEIYNEETGAVDGGWQQGGHWGSVYDQTWSATGYIRMILTDLLGMRFTPQGLTFNPDAKLLGEFGVERLSNLRYLNGRLDISVSGKGDKLVAVKVNGKTQPANKPIAPSSGTTQIGLIIK
ncbi:MAG: acetylxylan esterase [Prevotella sp.]|nr:acetylxylan esterase [Prevotella sp.]